MRFSTPSCGRFSCAVLRLSTPDYFTLRFDSSLVAAIQDQLGLAREKERGPDRAMAIPARKVFLEATPVVEVAAQVLPDQASSVLRRAYAALIPP
jgi:hypothetical protein